MELKIAFLEKWMKGVRFGICTFFMKDIIAIEVFTMVT
jgi:hypothetical protein